MSVPVSSTQDLYDLFIVTIQNIAPDLTDTLDGAIVDGLAGVFAVAASEVQRQTVLNFAKTFIELANGPAITGGPDDLQTLVTDHFGDAFARPQAIAAIDTVTFSRANNNAGQIPIVAGSIVKTAPDANGNAQRYFTANDIILTNTSAPSDLTAQVNVTAVVAGKAGNAAVGTINVIETGLLDSTIVVTNAGNETGADAEDDSAYRETIRNLIEAIAGATLAAVKAAALSVSGITSATPIETAMTAIQWDPINAVPIGSSFLIPRAKLYVADATGTASPALLAAVRAKIKTVKAAGVFIEVLPASAQVLDWTGKITLNPSGPNYSSLVNDTSPIIASMKNYIDTLPTGTSFIRSVANAAIMAIWGPAGTDDLTAFTTSVPSGDVSATATTKFVSGDVKTA